jgi:hypothetical protein
MSVSAELLCSFELLKPLDSSALKSHIKRGRNMRNNLLNSPVSKCAQGHAPRLLCSLLTLHSLLHHLLKAFNSRSVLLGLFETGQMLSTPASSLAEASGIVLLYVVFSRAPPIHVHSKLWLRLDCCEGVTGIMKRRTISCREQEDNKGLDSSRIT